MEKKFLRKPPSAPAREAPRRWRARRCPGQHSSPRAPAARRKVRLEPVLPAVAALSSGGRASGSRTAVGGLQRGEARPGRPGLAGRRQARVTLASPPPVGAVERRFRRDSLFCPDELDSLFSYFDAGAAAAGPRSKRCQHPGPLPTPSLRGLRQRQAGLPGMVYHVAVCWDRAPRGSRGGPVWRGGTGSRGPEAG